MAKRRSPNINNLLIGGNVVRDPELRHVGEEKTSVTSITIANNRSYKNKKGEWQEETTFVASEIWGPQAERVTEKCKKGDPLIIEGSLRQNKWEDADGNSRSKLYLKADRVHILNS